MNQFMLRTFSRRTSETLKAHTLFRLLLPPFQSFLDINVRKEEEKDRLVIFTSYEAMRAGKTLEEISMAPLLQAAREIDRKFLQQTSVLPVSITIQYEDIEPIRRERMELLLGASYRLFQQWENTPRVRTAFARLYNRDQFSALLRKILHLYNQEAIILSHSVRLPRMIGMARDKLSDTVYSVMEDVSRRLVPELTRRVYRHNK